MAKIIQLAVAISCSIVVCLSSSDFDDYFSPEDVDYFSKAAKEGVYDRHTDDKDYNYDDDDVQTRSGLDSYNVDCFGIAGFANKLKWLFNLRPQTSDRLQNRFYLTTRKLRYRLEIESGDQLGLEWNDFKPERRTIIIVHGFMSHSNGSWVLDLTSAFLDWNDVNVITVDWSKGGRTWKYWRAVANTRTVGLDLYNFLRDAINATGAETRNFHFVGHSLGAHISSYAASRLGGVKRITGLDPAQPCFRTSNKAIVLDKTDAEYVDVIHTNGRLIRRIGFGLPDPIGHADFYPNGGMKQPGCYSDIKKSAWQSILPISNDKIRKAMCSHRRSYLFFKESLLNKNCTFIGHQWNMTFNGVNASVGLQCDRKLGRSCGIMGIEAYSEATGIKSEGTFYVITKNEAPFCTNDYPNLENRQFLLNDLLKGYVLNKLNTDNEHEVSSDYDSEEPYPEPTTTAKPKKSGWWIFG